MYIAYRMSTESVGMSQPAICVFLDIVVRSLYVYNKRRRSNWESFLLYFLFISRFPLRPRSLSLFLSFPFTFSSLSLSLSCPVSRLAHFTIRSPSRQQQYWLLCSRRRSTRAINKPAPTLGRGYWFLREARRLEFLSASPLPLVLSIRTRELHVILYIYIYNTNCTYISLQTL